MDGLIEVLIPVEPEVAAMLDDPRSREEMGRLISRTLRSSAEANPLIEALRAAQADAAASGITEAEIEAELAAYNAERRTHL
jgi:hypothetical protein